MQKREVNRFVKMLKEKEITVAFAESVTCGMAAQTLSTSKGVSDVLLGSIVCYTPEVKNKLMGVSRQLIDQYTCESAEVTKALTEKLSSMIPADVCASLTGLASPGGSETKQKPVGTVFYCIKYRNRYYQLKKLYRGSPLEIRKKASLGLYQFILACIKQGV